MLGDRELGQAAPAPVAVSRERPHAPLPEKPAQPCPSLTMRAIVRPWERESCAWKECQLSNLAEVRGEECRQVTSVMTPRQETGQDRMTGEDSWHPGCALRWLGCGAFCAGGLAGGENARQAAVWMEFLSGELEGGK